MDPYILPSGTVEVPRIRLEVPVMCTYMRSMLMSADFGSMGYAPLDVMITQNTSIPCTTKLLHTTIQHTQVLNNYSFTFEFD